jgi:hypothetical protein
VKPGGGLCRKQLAGADEVVGKGAVGELDGGVLTVPPHFQPPEAYDQRAFLPLVQLSGTGASVII